MNIKIGTLSLILIFLALSGCVQAATVTPETPTAPPPSSPIPSPTALEPTITPVPPQIATVTPTEPDGPPVPTLEPILPPVAAAPLFDGPLTITYIQMTGTSNGWALGAGTSGVEQVLRTSDGGSTWRLVSPPEPAPDSSDSAKVGRLVAENSSTAWVTYQYQHVFTIPEEPRVWMTADGGETWQASRTLPIPGSFEFYNLSDFQRTRDGTGWLIAHIGVGMNHDYMALYQGSTNGIDWDRVVDPFETPFIQGCQKTGLTFLNSSIGWLGVDCQGVRDGAFFHQTKDGGRTWEERQLDPPPQAEDLFERTFCGVYDPHFLSDTEGVIVLRCLQRDFETQENYLYRTRSGGESWDVIPYPEGSLVFLSEEIAWALSRDIFQSIDTGNSWAFVKSLNWDGQFSFVDALLGWAVAEAEDDIALVKTVDGGQTWEIIEPQFTNLTP